MTPSDNEWDKYKVSAPKQTSSDDWDKYLVPKKAGGAGSPLTSPSLPSGLGNIPSIQALTDTKQPYTPVVNPQAKQQLQQRDEAQTKQDIQDAKDAKIAQDTQTRNLFRDPNYLKDLAANMKSQQEDLRKQLDDPHSQYYQDKAAKESEEEKNAYKGNIPLSDRVAAASNSIYTGLGSLGKGAVRAAGLVMKGMMGDQDADLWDARTKNVNDQIQKVVDWAHKYHNLDPKEEEAINKGAVNGMINGIAEYAPALASAERTGGMSLFMNDYEKAYEGIDKADKDNNLGLSETQKQLYSGANGLTSALLMTHNLHSILGNSTEKASQSLINKVSLKALGDLAASGEDLNSANLSKAIKVNLDNVADKVKNYGLKVGLSSAISSADMGGMQAVKEITDKLANTATGKQIFDTSHSGENIAHSAIQGAGFGAIVGGLAKSPLLLTEGTPERNTVIADLYKDPSQENADRIKSVVQQHLADKGLPEDDIRHTSDVVDQLHQVAKTLPKGLDFEKQVKVSDLLLQRKDLQSALDKTNAENSQVDPVFAEQHENHAQAYQDRIDSINDKIKSIASEVPIKYFKQEGEYYKQEGDKEPEKITEGRYYTEKPHLILNDNENESSNGEVRGIESRQENGQNGSEKVSNEGQKENGQEEVNATPERVEPQDNIDQHQNRNVSGEATEAGGGNSPERGGEVKQEEGSETSIKNAKIDSDREKRGLSPLMSEASKDFNKVWDGAMKKLDGNPNAGKDLVDALHDKPRATTDTENALIAHTLVEAKNDYDKANEAVVKAQDAGEDTTEHEAALERAGDRLHKIEEVARKTGTETARGLNSRKMMIRDDMSLANLETRKRVALGRKLTPDEREDLRKVHENYAAKEKEYEATIERLTQRNRDLQERQAMQDLKAQAKKESRVKRGETRKSDRDKLVQDIRAKLKVARTSERLNVSIPFAQQVAELYKISPELAKLAKSYIAEGVDKLEDLVDKIHEQLSEYDKRAIRDALSGYGRPTERETKPELQAKLDAMKQQARLLSKLEDLEKKEYKAPERKKAAVSAEIADLRKQVRELQQPDVSLKSIKTRTANQIKEYQRRLDEKDFSTPEKKPPTELDPEAIKAKADLNRVRDNYEAELEKDRLAKRGNWEKGWDKFLKYRRAELLLNLSGAAKVGMASAYRILSQPLHEIVGSVERQIPGIKQIAAKAPREGVGFVPEVEWKALKTVWNAETLSEVKKKFKGQLDNLDTAFGDKKEHFDTDRLLDLAGNIHSAEKEFAKQNEFRRSVLLRTKWAEENGVDTDNPLVQLQIGVSALKDANRQIFMADNIATTAYRSLLNYLESKSSETKFGSASKISAGVLKLMLPIVKVPTNYLIEKAQYTPVLGALKAVNIMRKGLSKMTPDQADYVMRIMKKQGIGAGLLAIGYANPTAFGGFHIPGKKRDENDPLNAGDVKLFGVSIPHYLTHTPLLTLLQLGATIRRASWGETAMGTAADFAESTPFYETPKDAVKAMESSGSMQQFIGNTLRGLIVPNIVSQAAQHFDTDAEGNQIKRSPKTIGQGIESGIPGLRQNVPIKSLHPQFDKIQVGEHAYHLSNTQLQEREKFYNDFMKTPAAKALKLEIAKTTNKVEKKKLSERLKTLASKVSKRRILTKYHNSETGGYNIEQVEE